MGRRRGCCRGLRDLDKTEEGVGLPRIWAGLVGTDHTPQQNRYRGSCPDVSPVARRPVGSGNRRLSRLPGLHHYDHYHERCGAVHGPLPSALGPPGCACRFGHELQYHLLVRIHCHALRGVAHYVLERQHLGLRRCHRDHLHRRVRHRSAVGREQWQLCRDVSAGLPAAAHLQARQEVQEHEHTHEGQHRYSARDARLRPAALFGHLHLRAHRPELLRGQVYVRRRWRRRDLDLRSGLQGEVPDRR
mmetsp:Transcript_47751/g.152548  ORF Transcript_47751/g.152548 Transcript_47751/m.152548 type:complete len:246 (+) Transcript_47751:64-801(+)